MRRIRLLVFAMLATAPAPALAAPCAGFTDVDTSNPNHIGFCPSVEWIRNRSVTSGCGGTNYCPDSVVNRLSMAVFMRNLGIALTPVDLASPPGGSAGPQTPASNPVPPECQTPVYTVADFPRRAYVNAMVTISAPSANIDVQADVVHSINAGPWTPIANSDQYATLYQPVPPATVPDQATLAPFGSVDLNVGQTVRFGIRLTLEAGSGTVNVACSTRAQIANRNSTTSPFDAAPAVAERSRGS